MTETKNYDLGVVISSDSARRLIYGIYTVLAIIVGGLAVFTTATIHDVPSWLVGAQAVIAYLAIPVGGLAVANSRTRSEVEVPPTGV